MAYKKQKSISLWLLLLFTQCIPLSAQEITVSGYIREIDSKEPISGARISTLAQGSQVKSNALGFFSLTTIPDSQEEIVLNISAIAYETLSQTITLAEAEQEVSFYLVPLSLEEVVIEGHQTQQELSLGRVVVPVSELKNVPPVLGEIDVIKALSLIPGFSTGIEGSSGLYVRGGTPDQNLILLDGAPVYNASHIFGFLSTFHPDVVQSVEAYKGAFPARYGGRLSSVIDIKTKEGNARKKQGSASVGLLSSRIFLEGPIQKNTTFTLAGRASYLGLFTLPQFLSYLNGGADNYFQYWLADGNARIHHRLKTGGQLSLSLYAGQDIWTVGSGDTPREDFRESLGWGNLTASLQYRQPIGKKVFWNSLLTGSRYQYHLNSQATIQIEDTLSAFSTSQKLSSGVRDVTWRNELDFYLRPRHRLSAGIEGSLLRFVPRDITIENSEEDAIEEFQDNIPAQSGAGFVDWEGKITPWLTLEAGIRVSTFRSDTLFAPFAEPRATLSVRLSDRWLWQGSGSILRQYLQLVSTNGIGLPNDIYLPSSTQFAPATSRSFSMGLFHKLPQYQTELSVEVYSKTFSDLIDFQLGTNILQGAQALDQSILTGGVGRAYGIELLARKSAGKWRGWAGYTLAWSERKFEDVNRGEWFASRFDRRHDLSLTATYKWNKYLTISGAFVFQSGRPFSFPVAFIPLPGASPGQVSTEFVYGERNQVRMPAYHRLDVGFQYHPGGDQSKCWAFGVYNFYDRRNPFFLSVRRVGSSSANGQPPVRRNAVYQTSLIPFLPYLSYEWKF